MLGMFVFACVFALALLLLFVLALVSVRVFV